MPNIFGDLREWGTLAVIVGACDVMNPAAITATGSSATPGPSYNG
jgi:hypothetical protein